MGAGRRPDMVTVHRSAIHRGSENRCTQWCCPPQLQQANASRSRSSESARSKSTRAGVSRPLSVRRPRKAEPGVLAAADARCHRCRPGLHRSRNPRGSSNFGGHVGTTRPGSHWSGQPAASSPTWREGLDVGSKAMAAGTRQYTTRYWNREVGRRTGGLLMDPRDVAVRVIPCLDVDAGRVVKGVNFENLRDAGDPVELAAAYDREGADELTFLDVTASRRAAPPCSKSCVAPPSRYSSRSPSVAVCDRSRTSTCCCAPVPTRSRQHRRDCPPGTAGRTVPPVRVAVHRAVGRRSNGPRGFRADPVRLGSHHTRWSARHRYRCRRMGHRGAELGVGEILLNSMDADGTKAGFDLRCCVRCAPR